MRVLCVQLFFAGQVEDALLVWHAKTASMDSFASIDGQMMCGVGLSRTKAFLAAHESDAAAKALAYLEQWDEDDDLDGFSVDEMKAQYAEYYGVDTDDAG